MKLLTEELKKKLPKLYSQDGKKPEDVKIIVKFFTPDSGWSWYAVEYDQKDTFFGYVRGMDNELGYFTLSELESVTGPMGMHIERDMYFGDYTLKEVMDRQI